MQNLPIIPHARRFTTTVLRRQASSPPRDYHKRSHHHIRSTRKNHMPRPHDRAPASRAHPETARRRLHHAATDRPASHATAHVHHHRAPHSYPRYHSATGHMPQRMAYRLTLRLHDRGRLGLLCAPRKAVAPHGLQLPPQLQAMRRWCPCGFATHSVRKSSGTRRAALRIAPHQTVATRAVREVASARCAGAVRAIASAWPQVTSPQPPP
jgi:hypothetical protein